MLMEISSDATSMGRCKVKKLTKDETAPEPLAKTQAIYLDRREGHY